MSATCSVMFWLQAREMRRLQRDRSAA